MMLFTYLAVILATCSCNYTLPTKPPPYEESLKDFKVTENIFTDVILSMAGDVPHLNDYRRQYSEITHAAWHIAWNSVIAENCNLETVNIAKFFGVHVVCFLTWKCELTRPKDSIHSACYVLRSLRDIAHLEQLRTVYFSLVESKLSQTYTEDLYIQHLEEAVAQAISNTTYVVGVTKDFIDHINAKTDALQKLVNIGCANNINDRDCDEVIQNFILAEQEKYASEASLLLIAGESAKVFNTNSNKFLYISKELDAHKYVIQRPVELKIVVEAFKKIIPLINSNETVC